MEFEANLSAAQIVPSDEGILEYIYRSYSVGQIGGEMESDINLLQAKSATSAGADTLSA